VLDLPRERWTFTHALRRQAAARGDETYCAFDDGRSLSYKTLDEQSNRLAAGLASLGIGPRDRAAADMVAVRVTGPMKMALVGAPAYFALRRPPRTPDDLARHNCVQYRLAEGGNTLVWPLLRNGKTRRITVEGRVMVNDANLATRAAVDGLGIAFTPEALAEPFLRSRQLVRVLEDWSPSFEGIFVYYPGHRQVPASLRAFIDILRATRGSAPPRILRNNPFAKE